MSRSSDIADAVVAYVNGQGYAWKFDAERLVFPSATVEASDGLLVSVFMGPRVSDLFDRGRYQVTHTVYLVVQKKLPADAADLTAETDDLINLVESIESSLEAVDLADLAMVGYNTATERIPYNLEAVRQAGVFSSITAFDYVGHYEV